MITISMLQFINSNLNAKLIEVPGLEWNVDFHDPTRATYHQQKMKSKDERPAKQLQYLGIPSGKIIHIKATI